MIFLVLLSVIAIVLFSSRLFWQLSYRERVPKVPILTYHKVEKRFEWGIARTTPGRFEKQIRFLIKEGYQSISISSLANQLISGKQIPERSIVIAFDDGYESVCEYVWPVLRDYGFTGTVFIIAGYVGCKNLWDANLGWLRFKHLGWDQLEELTKSGFEIGSHTMTHRDLTNLGKEEIIWEMEESRRILSDRLGITPKILSYPFGRYNKMTQDIAQELGYAITCSLSSHSNNSDTSQPLRQIGIYLVDTMFDFRVKVSLSRFFWLEDLKMRLINSCSVGTVVAKELRGIIRNK